MSQWSGSLYIQVLDNKDWEKLYDIEIDESYALWGKTGKDVFGSIKGTEWYIDGEWSPAPSSAFYLMSGLGGLFMEIRRRLRDRCIMYGSLVNINTDPYYLIFYSFGEAGYDSKEILLFDFSPNITNPEQWFKWANIKMTTPRIKHLLKFKDRFDYLTSKSPIKRIPEYGEQQNRARIVISVKDPALWKKAATISIPDSFALPMAADELFGNLTGYDLVIEKDWHLAYGSGTQTPLSKLVAIIKKVFAPNEYTIFADCADPNQSPFYSYLFVIDGKVVKDEVLTDLSSVRITDLSSWIRLADIRMSEKRTLFLSEFPSSLFDFTRGGVSMLDSSSSAENWMAGKIFVLTGFSDAEEKQLTRAICSRNGIVKSSTVLNTDYVIYNPNYDHETTKLRRAKELISRGKQIVLLTGEEFRKRI